LQVLSNLGDVEMLETVKRIFNFGLSTEEVRKIVLFYRPSPEWQVSRESLNLTNNTLVFQPLYKKSGPSYVEILQYIEFVENELERRNLLEKVCIEPHTNEVCILANNGAKSTRSNLIKIKIR
jgi:hypothetical protein